MTRNALVTGASGFLGRKILLAFQEAGWDVVGTGFSRAKPPQIVKLDLADETAVTALLDDAKPQVVIHSAANRFPDKCEADPEGTRALNVNATSSLAKATASRNILLIYISTDYVFPGKEGEAPYEADASPHPINLYGQTKLDGEKAMLDQTKGKHLGVVLRVPVLYGTAEEPKESAVNVLEEAVMKAQDKDAKIQMDHWAKRYPTNTEDVARVCQDLATKYLEANDSQRAELPTTLQFSSDDCFTKYEICQLMAEILGLPLDGMIANTAGNDPKSGTQRPYDTGLSTKALKELGIPIWTQDFKAWWRIQMKAVRH